jgi:hypothetical protein
VQAFLSPRNVRGYIDMVHSNIACAAGTSVYRTTWVGPRAWLRHHQRIVGARWLGTTPHRYPQFLLCIPQPQHIGRITVTMSCRPSSNASCRLIHGAARCQAPSRSMIRSSDSV